MTKKAQKNVSLKKQLFQVEAALNRYKGILFFLILAGLYSFILLRINVLSKVNPSDEQESTAKQSAIHISESTVQKMYDLRDNSVRVQTIFNEARENPFQ